MASTDFITNRGGKYYVTVNGEERGFYNKAMANRYIGHNALKRAMANEALWTHNADLVNRQLGINTQGSKSNSYFLKGAARQSYVNGYENFWQTALSEQDAKLRNSVTNADFTTHYGNVNELRNKGPLGNVTGSNTPAVKGGTPKPYVDNGFRFYEHPGMNTNVPAGNTPAGNTPAGNTPASNTPAANTPAGNTPASNTPAANQGAKLPKGTSGIRKNPPIGDPKKLKYVPEGGETVKPNAKKGFKIPKGLKKAGKIGLAIVGLGLLGWGISKLFGGGDDKKVEETAVKPEESTTPPAVDTQEEQPVAEQPVAEQPAYEPIVKLNDDGTYTTKKNDNFYKLAENLLKDYCATNGIDETITNKSPEVQILAEQIMKANKYWYDPNCTEATKRYSAPMLYPDENLIIPDFSNIFNKEQAAA